MMASTPLDDNANDLLCSLHERGVKVWAEGGNLRFRAPPGTLLQDDVQKLRRSKVGIVELLRQMDFSEDALIQVRAADCSVPLTPVQLWMWKRVAKKSGLSVRYSSTAMRVAGLLDVELLKLSLDGVVWRHEALRTRILVRDGVPIQHIDDTCSYEWEVIDLSGLAAQTAKAELERLSERIFHENFSLSVGPVFVAKLVKISDRDHLLILSMDHIITDGFSARIMIQEIWTRYEQGNREVDSWAAERHLQLGDYAVWLNRTFGAWLQMHEGYWKNFLAVAPVTRIAIIQASEGSGGFSEIGRISLGRELTGQLRAVACQERVLLPLVVMTIYIVVMSQWCEQRDLTISFTSSARYRSSLQGLVGCLSDEIYLRAEIAEGATFLDLLKRVSSEFRCAYAHPAFGRPLHWEPGFKTDLNFNWSQIDGVHSVHELAHSCIRVAPSPLPLLRFARFGLLFGETNTEIYVDWGCRSDLVAMGVMDRWGRHLCQVARRFVRERNGRVDSVIMT